MCFCAASVCVTFSIKLPDQTEAVAFVLEALLLCQLCEGNRQKEAKGGRVESRKWGKLYSTADGEGWLPAVWGGGG